MNLPFIYKNLIILNLLKNCYIKIHHAFQRHAKKPRYRILMGPQRDSRKTGKPRQGTLLGSQKNQKTGTQEPSGTLARPQKNQKTVALEPSVTLMRPQKNLKPGTQDLSGILAGPQKNRKTGTQVKLRKPKTRNTVPQWGSKTGKTGPNVTLEKHYNCKSTFICVLVQKVTEFREQSFKHFNLI